MSGPAAAVAFAFQLCERQRNLFFILLVILVFVMLWIIFVRFLVTYGVKLVMAQTLLVSAIVLGYWSFPSDFCEFRF